MENLAECVEGLYCKNNAEAYHYCKLLLAESERSDAVYPFCGQFADMLAEKSAYLRTRGLLLLCANAKWDTAGRLDGLLDDMLPHILDEKPTVSRQFIAALPQLAAAKPALAGRICEALREADVSIYADSMAPLVWNDMQNALRQIVG